MKPNVRYIVYWLIISSLSANAQFGAKFSVVSDAGCAPFTVSVIDSSGAPSGNVNVYNYGEVATVTQDTFYTYTTPGIYEITQLVPNGNPRDTSLFIEVVNPTIPRFNLSNCKGANAFFHGDDSLYKAFYVSWGDGNSEIILNKQIQQHNYPALGIYNVTVQGMMDPNQNPNQSANINCSNAFASLNLIADIIPGTIDRIEVLNEDSILLNFTIDPNTSYYLEMSQNGSLNFNIIDTLSVNSLPSNYIINNLSSNSDFYCFRLTAFDPCDGATSPSSIACSVLLDGTAINNQNILNWTTETFDLNTYDLEKDGNYIISTNNINYMDGDVDCGLTYCYQVILNENNGLQSYSNEFCITAISIDSLAAITNINASINNNQPTISWDIPTEPYSNFYITRFEEGGGNQVDFKTTTNTFIDSTATPDVKKYYYTIFYEDLCGNFSESTVASPIFLSLYVTPTVRWTNYLGWVNNANTYILEIYDQNFQPLAEEDMGLDTLYTEMELETLPQVIRYRIRALPAVGNLPTVFSNFLEVTFPSNVVFPNAFTPNGDGLNDVFSFKGLYISAFKMNIFNKWGELIYHTENPDNGWNGMKNNIPAPSGMYIFNAEFTDQSGISFVKKGEVYLLR